MYKVNIVAVGDLKEKYFKEAEEEYLKRLKKFCHIEIIEIKEVYAKGPSKLDKEFKLILPNLKGTVIICSIKGKMMPTKEFKDMMLNSLDKGIITFVIGGSEGLSKTLEENNFCLSLSKMTFPHHLCRLILEEQIYRAFTIKSGMPYDK